MTGVRGEKVLSPINADAMEDPNAGCAQSEGNEASSKPAQSGT